jgi:hypothetical protein
MAIVKTTPVEVNDAISESAKMIRHSGIKARVCLAYLAIAMSSASLHAQPSIDGEWSGVFTWGQGGGIEAIHVHMLPTGKVMFWQTWRESIGRWDPVTEQFSTAAFPLPNAHNPFCSGHAWLPDGRLFIAGGNIDTFEGLNFANIYNPFTNTWANNVPNLPVVPAGAPYGAGRSGRWYPSATTLGNGDILVMSGSMVGAAEPDAHPLPQVYSAATNSWRNLTTAYKELPLYPRTFLAPDGRVVSLSGLSDETEFLDTTGTGSWSYLMDTLDNNLSNYGPAVMYDTGKIAYIGGGHNPTKNVSLLDLNDSTPAWRYGADDMAQPRRQNNITILADGTVLITGGSSTTGFNEAAGRVTIAEIWDPVTEQVEQVAQASDLYRGYHSTALLLPDGRVLVTGGDHDSGGPAPPQNLNAEIYSPAYLFKGPRPTVTAAPTSAELGQTIFVETPNADDIAKALIVVPGSVTHAQNWTQRANQLEVEAVAGGVNITLPSNPNEAPPGYYMLFLINETGVPSIANFIRAELPTPLIGDYNDNGTVDAADYAVWRDNTGTSFDLPNDLIGGTIGLAHYNQWRAHFGQSDNGGSGANVPAAVPEPSIGMMLLAIAIISRGRFCKRVS